MKIRNGFVSNSSSSSFVVFVPDDFTLDYKAIEEQYEDEIDIDILKDMVNTLKKGHGLWRDDSYQEYDIIEEELRDRDLIVVSIDTGPDASTMDVITKEQITDIYNKYVGGSK